MVMKINYLNACQVTWHLNTFVGVFAKKWPCNVIKQALYQQPKSAKMSESLHFTQTTLQPPHKIVFQNWPICNGLSTFFM
jgi:hypothetical protein